MQNLSSHSRSDSLTKIARITDLAEIGAMAANGDAASRELASLLYTIKELADDALGELESNGVQKTA